MQDTSFFFKKRTRFWYVVVSTSFTAILLGVYLCFLLTGQILAKNISEQLEVFVELKAESNDSTIAAVQEYLKRQPYLRSETLVFTTKEAALIALQEDFKEDFLPLDLTNPLLDVYTFNVTAAYSSSDSLEKIKEQLEGGAIESVFYQEAAASMLEENMSKITQWGLIFVGIFLLVALAIINSTVRLTFFTNRFTIKHMQLIGATDAYILRPYLGQAFLLGIASSVVSLSIIWLIINRLSNAFPELYSILNLQSQLMIGMVLLIVCIIPLQLSTYFTMKTYLKKPLGNLYLTN